MAIPKPVANIDMQYFSTNSYYKGIRSQLVYVLLPWNHDIIIMAHSKSKSLY